MGALPQALEIIFEVQMKRSKLKISQKKIKHFNLQNTTLLPITISLDLHHLWFILSDLKWLWEHYLKLQKSSVQMKRSKLKISQKKIKHFNLQNTVFFFSYFLWTSLTFKAFNLLNFLAHFKCFKKCYRNTTFSSVNHFGILILTKQHTRNFLGDRESTL